MRLTDKIALGYIRRRISQDEFVDAVLALVGDEVARRNANAEAVHAAADERARRLAITEFEKSFASDAARLQ